MRKWLKVTALERLRATALENVVVLESVPCLWII